MVMMLPPSSIRGAAARARAISEYTLTSWEIRKPSRVVLTKSPLSSSAGAKATLCTSTCSLPYCSLSLLKSRSTASSFETSHMNPSAPGRETIRSLASCSSLSFWQVTASVAPALCNPWAMDQAIERLLATPKTTAVRPWRLNDMDFSCGNEQGKDNRNISDLRFQIVDLN